MIYTLECTGLETLIKLGAVIKRTENIDGKGDSITYNLRKAGEIGRWFREMKGYLRVSNFCPMIILKVVD